MGEVYVRTSAGRIHKAVDQDGHRLVNEACNLDDAPGTEREIDNVELEGADPADLCQQPTCFGSTEG